MKFKRTLSMFLACSMSVALLAGCGGNTDPEKTEPQKTDATGTSAAAPANYEHSWEEDTSDCTITWFWAYDWYGKKFDEVNNEFDKKLYEKTGIKIDVQTGGIDKLNMMIQTGKLPDVITLEASSTQRKLLEDQGLVQPLGKLRDEYAPDFAVPQSMIDWYTAPDGNWYSVASFYYGDDNIKDNKGYYETHNQNFVREDLLNEIGMTKDDLRTKEGFLNALRAVKEKNLQYNGQQVVPYMGLFTDSRGDFFMAQQLGASLEDKNGNFQSYYTTPEYREAMLMLNQMYREGLMTDESLTVNQDQLEKALAAGRVFATTGRSWATNARSSLHLADNNARIAYAGQFTGDTNKEVLVPAVASGGWTATMINKDAEDPDRIIRLFAYLSSKEAVMDNLWGTDCWTMDADGIVTQNADIIELEQSDPVAAAKFKGDFPWIGDHTLVQGSTGRAEGTPFADDDYLMSHDDRITVYDGKCFANVVPDAGSEESTIETRVEEYMKQAIGRIITASSAEECEAELDSALTEIEQLGLSKLVEYQNTQFQQNKQRLGLKFAFPGNN